MKKEPSELAKLSDQANEDSHLWFPRTADDVFFMASVMQAEAGEAVNEIKKWVREGRGPTPVERHKAIMEVTDTFTYTLAVAGLMKFDLQRSYEMKRMENVKRFGNGKPAG